MSETKKYRPTFQVSPEAMLERPAQPQTDEPVVSAEPDEELQTGVVSDGHVIHLNTTRTMRGFDATTGLKIYRQNFVTAGPGTEVTLPASSIAALKASGHLKNPDRTYGAPAGTIVHATVHGNDVDKPGLVSSTTNGAGH